MPVEIRREFRAETYRGHSIKVEAWEQRRGVVVGVPDRFEDQREKPAAVAAA